MARTASLLSRLLGAAPPTLKRAAALKSVTLSASDAQGLRSASLEDGQDYWLSGLLSLGNGCRSASNCSFTWATVQAYYAAFYLTRAVLAFQGTSINFVDFRGDFRHIGVVARAGETPFPISGNTHDGILRYADKNSSIPRMSNQPISHTKASEWLVEQRNLANYKVCRFSDPSPTPCMATASRQGIRPILNAYLATPLTFAFDEDHAILAYPVAIAVELARAQSNAFTDAEKAHLRQMFSDQAGPIASVEPLLSE